MTKSAVAGIAGAAVLSTAVVTGAASPAFAAMGKGRVQICAVGNYGSYLSFVGNRPLFATYVAAPGQCVKADIPVGTTRISVFGLWSSGNSFEMGAFLASASDDPGWKVYTSGSTANGGATRSWWANRN
ncbi:hypothetical protein [Paractinoplanes hotanensis]|uniref:Secreted protein n=1 Tax=Paractinoplanes hotanensis TaxID=2906497 RepID=A0ABT0YFJ9_9ACTN|nr:hypothetical protein [Actinoplanes hotanensis]MCM4084288.1 hypothetical protein [Actinoplanes hotanensis]